MVENNNILVSVCMITYKHEAFIEQAIMGILNQDVDFNIELLIADDKSPDDTENIVKGIQENHPNGRWINYIRHQENKGMLANFAWALDACKGKYIALCEGDDYWTDRNKLKKQVDFLETHPEYSLVLSNVENLYEYNPEAEGYNFWKYQINSNTDFDVSTENLISQPMGSLTAGSLFRKKYCIPNEKLDQSMGGEIRLWMVLSKYGKIRFMHEATATYRRQTGSISHSKSYTIAEVSFLINRINYFQALNNYFEYKYQKQFEEKIAYVVLEFIQKQQQLNISWIKRMVDLSRIVTAYPGFLKMIFKWIKVKLGMQEVLFQYATGNLLADSQREVFMLKNNYGAGKYFFEVVDDEKTLPLGSFDLYTAQNVYIKMPKLQMNKKYVFEIYESAGKSKKMDSINFTLQ